jgi:uncharacterized short protein YbdD (DUF466 family)
MSGKARLSEQLRLISKRLDQCGHLMVGVPDYETYVAHIARAHPGQAPMTYKEFFRERQAALRRRRREGHALLLTRCRRAAHIEHDGFRWAILRAL